MGKHTEDWASLDFARRVFAYGTFFGQLEIRSALQFELSVSDEVRTDSIRFDKEELKAAAGKHKQVMILGPEGLTMRQILDLTHNKTSWGKPLLDHTEEWEGEPAFESEGLRGGYRLVDRDVVLDSLDRDYIGQIYCLIDRVKEVHGTRMPPGIAAAIREFTTVSNEELGLYAQEVGQLVKGGDGDELTKDQLRTVDRYCTCLRSIPIRRFFAETAVEVLWYLVLSDRVYGERRLADEAILTSSIMKSVPGHFIRIGNFSHKHGIEMFPMSPTDTEKDAGIRLSRNAFDL